MTSQKQKSTISLWSMVLIVLSTEFSFSNIVTGYNQMSYAGIIWYIICALAFLLPLVLIFGEYSSALKTDHGGFYSWLVNSYGEKWAFIGTFVWVGVFLINLLQNISGLGIMISGLVFGRDNTQQWHFGLMDSNEIEACLGIVAIVLSTFLATKGVRKIASTATVGGVISLSMIGIFMISSIVIFCANHFRFAQPIHGVASFIKSPNPQFQTPTAIVSFIIYAMFSYGGLESSSGMIDRLKDPQKNYPKAMLWVSFILMGLSVFGIFLCGFATNWRKIMDAPGVNLYNNNFVLMNNLGEELSRIFGFSAGTGAMIGTTLVRVLALGVLIPMMSLLTVLIYSPIKGLIAGSSKDLWPKKIAQFNKHQMPSRAMWIECGIIVIILFLVSMTGKSGKQFYAIIVDMGNVGTIIPYFFLVIGFLCFKHRHDIQRPIVFFHSKKSVDAIVSLLLLVMGVALIFNVISPVMQNDYSTAFWTVAGPLLFIGLASVMYYLGIRHRAKRMIKDNLAYEKMNQ